MNRRQFLKAMSAAGASVLAPSSFNMMYKNASAAINYAGANVVAPSVMPQVINIFLYGGPSELAGNLTNIADIEVNSQNSYATAFGNRILMNDTDGTGANGFITKHGFWRGTPNATLPHLDDNGAGGREMQFMLDQGYMSVYRTMMKRLDGTRSHRESILMSQKGSLDIEVSAGVGTKLAATLLQHRALFENTATTLADGLPITSLENLFLPFVSFEGETRTFAQDPNVQIPLLLRGLTLDQNFDNPYSRNLNPNDTDITALVNKVVTTEDITRYRGVANAFQLRDFLELKMAGLTPGVAVNTTTDSSGVPLPLITGFADSATDAAALGLVDGDRLVYPNNNFTNRIRAAVTLALKNPSSLFITVGGGLGGWDDHNNATTDYRNRMRDLMATLKAAMLHIKYFGNTPILGGGTRASTSNIAINMLGDFGRLVNLNGAQGGWDHGNNQNLYTFGFNDADAASPRPTGALGKVMGRTVRVGQGGQNNQVTEPAPGSYEAEPMSVASTVYSYFGVQNPQILTADDEFNPAGVPAINEALAVTDFEPPLF